MLLHTLKIEALSPIVDFCPLSIYGMLNNDFRIHTQVFTLNDIV